MARDLSSKSKLRASAKHRRCCLLAACGGASWCFALWQQRWLVVAGCGCELLREHGHLLLILLAAVLLCCVLAARAGRLIAGLAMK